MMNHIPDNWTYKGKEYDKFTGITTRYYTEPIGLNDDGEMRYRVHLVHVQDIEDALKAAQRSRVDEGECSKLTDGAFRAALVPPIMIEKWLREYGFNWFKATPQEQRMWLERPENKRFKMTKKKLAHNPNTQIYLPS